MKSRSRQPVGVSAGAAGGAEDLEWRGPQLTTPSCQPSVCRHWAKPHPAGQRGSAASGTSSGSTGRRLFFFPDSPGDPVLSEDDGAACDRFASLAESVGAVGGWFSHRHSRGWAAAGSISSPSPADKRAQYEPHARGIPPMIASYRCLAKRLDGWRSALSARILPRMYLSGSKNLPAAARLGLVAAGLLLAGCAPRCELALHQPGAPESQQNLRLTSECASEAIDGRWQTTLLSLPLPGAAYGPPAFAVYVRSPRGAAAAVVDSADPQGARGFFVQEVGALAGRSDLVAGTLKWREVPWSGGQRQMELDVRCEDGTRIRGRAVLQGDPAAVRAFERQHSGDVASLTSHATTAPATGTP